MGKLQDKRIELAKKILDTTDAATLAVVEDALSRTGHYRFSPEQIEEFEAIRERMRSGEDRGHAWADVKKRARAQVRK